MLEYAEFWRLNSTPIQGTKSVTSIGLGSDQAMEVDGGEGNFAGELDPHHDHSRDPEKEDVVPCLHDSRGVEALQVWR